MMKHLRRHHLRSVSGMSLMSTIVGIALFGLFVVITTRLATQDGARSRHLEDRGRVDHIHAYIRNSLSCTQTLKDQRNICLANGYVNVRDHAGRSLIERAPKRTVLDELVELKARCVAEDGHYLIEPSYRLRKLDGTIHKDKLTGKVTEWKPFTEGVPFACACFQAPAASIALRPAAAAGGYVRSTLFYSNVAVDPGATGVDDARAFGLTPYPLSPPTTLSRTTFQIPADVLSDLVANQGVESIELTAFAHQFLRGLDRVGIDFQAIGISESLDSIPNIYSAYGYVHLSDLRVQNGIPRGKVNLRTFEHSTGATALGITSIQDATSLIRPMSPVVPPSHVFNDADLRDLKITVRLYADTYDSVQYRALRVNLWGKQAVPEVGACP